MNVNDLKPMILPFAAGAIVALVACYLMGGLNLSSTFNLGTKKS